MAVKVGINGFGRIGRAFFRAGFGNPDLHIVAINDLGDVENLAYLLRYDSAYRKYDRPVEVREGKMVVDGVGITFVQQKDPAQIPWNDLGVDVVVESTGFFESYDKAAGHLQGGAKRVIITAPAKETEGGVQGATVLMGLNNDRLANVQVSSNASCTTNSASPLMAILHEKIGIKKALLNTVHGYTASQTLVDAPMKGDFRRGRAAAQNITPSSTGAAVAVTKALPELDKLFDGISVRVPVVTGSIVDVTFLAAREVSAEEVNQVLKDAAGEERWKGIFAVTEEPLVSSDIIGNPHASIADLAMTRVVGGDLVKVLAWYDNEMGYAHTLVRHVIEAGKLA